jgi:hypothetical protein
MRFLPVARDSGTIAKGDRVTQLFGVLRGRSHAYRPDTHHKPQEPSRLFSKELGPM